MATAVAQQPQAFSSLALFECTITNASMLVDSMPLRELVLALKVVAQLQGHLLEVLEPTAGQASEVVEEHSRCPPVVQASTSMGEPKQEDRRELKVKKEEVFEEDDVVIVEADDDFSVSELDSSYLSGDGRGPPSKAAKTSGDGELSNEWKTLIRNAYKSLKEAQNSNIFDFSVPYTYRKNQEAAQLVINKAFEMAATPREKTPMFLSLCQVYLKSYYMKTIKYNYVAQRKKLTKEMYLNPSRLFIKLNRRQKSFDSLKAEIPESEQSKYKVILSREYTSSDEEGDGDARVKELQWESRAAKELKKRLDDHFLTSLADEKQKAELRRVRRVPGVLSARPAPKDGQTWARI